MWSSYEDIINEWVGEEPYPINRTVTEKLISRVEANILRAFPDIQKRIETPVEDGGLDIIIVQGVISDIVIGYVTSGNGLSQRSSTRGPYSEQKTYSPRSLRTNLYLTDEDKKALEPSASNAFGSLDSIHPNYGPRDGWIPLSVYSATYGERWFYRI